VIVLKKKAVRYFYYYNWLCGLYSWSIREYAQFAATVLTGRQGKKQQRGHLGLLHKEKQRADPVNPAA